MGLESSRRTVLKPGSEYFMKNITVASLVAAPLLALAMAMPSFADTTCKDGTTTTSTGKGTCSGHGGVQKAAASAATPAPAAPAAAAPKAPAAPATGATTTCKDGTTTTSSGKGTCSGHGGIQKATKGEAGSRGTAAPPCGGSIRACRGPSRCCRACRLHDRCKDFYR